MKRSGFWFCTCVPAALSVSSAVNAQETTTYSYDVHGRVTGWATTGTVNNGFRGVTTYDSADNIKVKSVTQQPPAAPVARSQAAPVRKVDDTTASGEATTFSTGAKLQANETPRPR